MNTVLVTAVVVLGFVWIPFLWSSWKLAQEEELGGSETEEPLEEETRDEEELPAQEA